VSVEILRADPFELQRTYVMAGTSPINRKDAKDYPQITQTTIRQLEK